MFCHRCKIFCNDFSLTIHSSDNLALNAHGCIHAETNIVYTGAMCWPLHWSIEKNKHSTSITNTSCILNNTSSAQTQIIPTHRKQVCVRCLIEFTQRDPKYAFIGLNLSLLWIIMNYMYFTENWQEIISYYSCHNSSFAFKIIIYVCMWLAGCLKFCSLNMEI